MIRTSLKPRKCPVKKGGCGVVFTPSRPRQKVCGEVDCAIAYGAWEKASKAGKVAKDDRRQTRSALEAIKTVPKLKKEAQVAFNAWVRWRDREKPCISCGAPPPDLSTLHAGRDCGHFRSTGSADHLRYTEDNAHAQCVRDNQWGAGMAVEYRIGLIARIGLARVEALEQNNTPQKWTRDGLRAIRDGYRAKLKAMKSA